MRTIRVWQGFVFAWALLPMLAAAQTETGRITGAVTDSQGAVVPGATVTATNVGTQIARTGVSVAQGRYTIANVPPALYDVSFQLTGFKTVTKRVQVNVGAEVANGVPSNGPTQSWPGGPAATPSSLPNWSESATPSIETAQQLCGIASTRKGQQ